MTAIATDCITNLENHLKNIVAVGKVFHVYGEDELMNKTKGISFPAVGVVYEGMRPTSEGDKATHKLGISAELVASVMMFHRPDNMNAADTKTPAMTLLDSIRKEIMGSKSPTGHFWKFVVEAAATEKNGVVIWIQRWSTPVQLVPVVR